MLYKNGKEFAIPKEHKKELLEKFPKFPVVLKYHPSKVKYDRNNKINKAPEVLAIPTTSSAKVFDQHEQFTWAINTRVDKKGTLITTPRNVQVVRQMIIQENQLDLLWYLYYVAPRISNNALESRTPYFVFEDKARDAQIEENKEKRELKLKVLVFDDDNGLSPEELKEVARTFNVAVDDMTISEIRVQIMKVIGNDQEKYDKFIRGAEAVKKSDSGELVDNIVAEALKTNVIIYNAQKFTYYFTDSDNEEGIGSVLVKMGPTKKEEAQEKLVKTLSKKKDVLEELKKEVEFRKEHQDAPI